MIQRGALCHKMVLPRKFGTILLMNTILATSTTRDDHNRIDANTDVSHDTVIVTK